jgi:hypothetical protein
VRGHFVERPDFLGSRLLILGVLAAKAGKVDLLVGLVLFGLRTVTSSKEKGGRAHAVILILFLLLHRRLFLVLEIFLTNSFALGFWLLGLGRKGGCCWHWHCRKLIHRGKSRSHFLPNHASLRHAEAIVGFLDLEAAEGVVTHGRPSFGPPWPPARHLRYQSLDVVAVVK